MAAAAERRRHRQRPPAYFGSLAPSYAAASRSRCGAGRDPRHVSRELPVDLHDVPDGQTVFRHQPVRYLWPIRAAVGRRRATATRCRAARCSSSAARRQARREKKPVSGNDGHFVADRFVAFAVMGTARRLGRPPFPICCATATLTTPPSRRHEARAPASTSRVPGLPQASRQDRFPVLARSAWRRRRREAALSGVGGGALRPARVTAGANSGLPVADETRVQRPIQFRFLRRTT